MKRYSTVYIECKVGHSICYIVMADLFRDMNCGSDKCQR